MFFEINLASRIFRTRRGSLARFTSIVAVAGLAVGVASLIFAQALARGFQNEMRDKILSHTAHISVFLNDRSEITDWQEIVRQSQEVEGVVSVEPAAFENALISGAEQTSYAVLRAVEQGDLHADLEGRIEISIGAELAERTGLKNGDEADLIMFENETVPRRTRVYILETFKTGLFDYDSTWIKISADDFARLHGRDSFTPSILHVMVDDIYSTDKTAAMIRKKLDGRFRVLDWQEANQPLFAALSLERRAATAVILLIILIAVLNITTTLALIVNERKLDIGVLRACGARGRSLVFLFVIRGLLLGIAGVAGGVLLGLLCCLLGNYFRWISISADVYSLSYIPLQPAAADILLTAGSALLLCLIATIYPAIRASRVKPLENLRSN